MNHLPVDLRVIYEDFAKLLQNIFEHFIYEGFTSNLHLI